MKTRESVFPRCNASRIGIIIFFRCKRAGFQAKFFQVQIADDPVRLGQDGDVSAGALEYEDIVSQLVRNNWRYRALSLIRLTMPRASANAWRGVSHPPVAL